MKTILRFAAICLVSLTLIGCSAQKKQTKKVEQEVDFNLAFTNIEMRTGCKYTIGATGADASKITWSTTKEKVATVNSHGQIEAVGEGSASIVAKVGDQEKYVSVDVSSSFKRDVVIYTENSSKSVASETGDKSSTNISEFQITISPKSFVYDGKEKRPTVTIRNNKRQRLVLNTDYTVQYKNNKKIGIATIIITGKGAYTGSTSYEFNITKKKVAGNKIGETDDGDDSWKSERAEDRKKREEAYKKAQQTKKYSYYQYKKKTEEKKKADEKKKAADKKKEEKKKKAEEKKKAQTNQN